jgi:hypothetical protein
VLDVAPQITSTTTVNRVANLDAAACNCPAITAAETSNFEDDADPNPAEATPTLPIAAATTASEEAQPATPTPEG